MCINQSKCSLELFIMINVLMEKYFVKQFKLENKLNICSKYSE